MDANAAKPIDPATVTTVIDKGVIFRGSIESTNGKTIQIHGQVIGNIESTSDVVIQEMASVHGSIKARRIRVAGTVDRASDGEPNVVEASELLTLCKTARFSASEASYADMEMELGAKISGVLRPTEAVQGQAAHSVPPASELPAQGGQVAASVVRFPSAQSQSVTGAAAEGTSAGFAGAPVPAARPVVTHQPPAASGPVSAVPPPATPALAAAGG